MFDLRVFLQSMITLASASLGLVAALAWNEAIKSTITTLLGRSDDLPGLWFYAVIATIIAVTVVLALSNAAARIGGDAAVRREAEG